MYFKQTPFKISFISSPLKDQNSVFVFNVSIIFVKFVWLIFTLGAIGWFTVPQTMIGNRRPVV